MRAADSCTCVAHLAEVDRPQLAFDLVHLDVQLGGPSRVHLDHQIGVAGRDRRVDFLEAAYLSHLLEGLVVILQSIADLRRQLAKRGIIRTEQLHLDGLAGPGQVVQLVLHDLSDIDLELMLVVLILDAILNFLLDLQRASGGDTVG